MRFTTLLITLATLASASPVPETLSEIIPISALKTLYSTGPLRDFTPPVIDDSLDIDVSTNSPAEANDLEARGSTPWHNCKCQSGYLTDETYSAIYEKTLARSANFDNHPVLQGMAVWFLGPTRYFLVVKVTGKNDQYFSQSRVGNIIHQLKVARGDKGCGTKPVICWTQGDDEITAHIYDSQA